MLNLIILILYRTGYKGEFLGVGGTWNLNEDKNPDAEIVASGVLVGFFIYTSVVVITYCFGSTDHKKTLVVRSRFKFYTKDSIRITRFRREVLLMELAFVYFNKLYGRRHKEHWFNKHFTVYQIT